MCVGVLFQCAVKPFLLIGKEKECQEEGQEVFLEMVLCWMG